MLVDRVNLTGNTRRNRDPITLEIIPPNRRLFVGRDERTLMPYDSHALTRYIYSCWARGTTPVIPHTRDRMSERNMNGILRHAYASGFDIV